MQTHPVVSEMITRHSLGRFRLDVNKITARQDSFDQLVPECDLCLTVSGTATLHVASFGVPMIVGSVLNSRVTGFQVVPTRKPKPNFWIASHAP